MNGQAVIDAEILVKVDGKLLEGPAWDARMDRLLFVDIQGRRLHRLDWPTLQLESLDVDETSSAYIQRASGGFAIASRSGLRLGDEPPGDLAVAIEADQPELRSNDAKCDPAGRLWFGTMADDEVAVSGSLYRIDADLTCTRVLSPVAISNGLGWSLDGGQMYFIDTPTQRVDVLDYDLSTGTAQNRRCLIDTQDLPGMPDGLTVDAEGCIWVAFYNGAAVRRFDPSGREIGHVRLPVESATSCTFAGPQLDVLVITTARADRERGADLYGCDPGVTGTPTVAFAG